MRVLLLSQYFFPEIGATQTRIYEFALALARRGHEVDVLTEFPNHPTGVIPPEYRGRWFEADGTHPFRVLRVWVATSPRKTFRTRLAFYGSFVVMALLATLRLPGRYDAVVATSPPLPVAMAGLVIARLKRAAFVMDVRDLWPKAAGALGELSNRWLYRLAERIEGELYRRAERVSATTRSFCRYIAEHGARAEAVVHVPNGTLEEVFAPERGEGDVRNRLGLEGKFVVTYAGLHGIAQGLSTVLEAAHQLGSEPDIQFVLIGEGPQKGELMARAARLGLVNVRFLPQVPLAACAHYLNASDVLLVPLARNPVFDMFVPSKLFDGMACGKPVLLSVDGEAREILEEAGGGLFVEAGDPRSLGDAIQRLYSNPALGKEMGERGRAFVLRHYLRRPQAEHFADVVAAAAAQRQARQG